MHLWPPVSRRRTMFAPIRPRPTTPELQEQILLCQSQIAAQALTPAASFASFPPAVAPDQRIGRAVVLELGFSRALELRNDLLGERLAQFDAPLVEGIDLPDGALGEDAVLVERNQPTQRGRRQAIEQ